MRKKGSLKEKREFLYIHFYVLGFPNPLLYKPLVKNGNMDSY